MDIKTKAELISTLPPFMPVFSDCSKKSPEFLPEINPKKNGLNISGKGGKYFGEGRYSLKVYSAQVKYSGFSVAL
ncbi:MAG: hypothetical protein M3R36_08565 [Bacteroidota bacterium]|nr:hypothetical protein [Bacteroidota bacterium]